MNIRYLKNFIKLAKYRNFSECASDLSISQSTLSHQISQIEEDLGNVKLIDRTTKKFEITEAGNIFLKYATQIIELYNNCELELEKYSKQKYDTITISASTIPGSHILPKLIAEYKDMNPNIIFNIKINNSEISIKNIIKNNADFVGIGSFMNYNPDQFEYIIIGSEELKFICSPNHELLKRGQNTVSFNQLTKYPFIWRESGSGMRKVFQQQFPYYNKLNIKLEMNDNDSIISTVSDSDFISIMSEMMAEKSEKANLIEILDVKEYPIVAKRELYFIKKKDIDLSDTKKDFWEFIKKKLNKRK
jgi:DNA-binding transcriptional LysR family regulator